MQFIWCNGTYGISKQDYSLIEMLPYFVMWKYDEKKINNENKGWFIFDTKLSLQDALRYFLNKGVISQREYDYEIEEYLTLDKK